MTTIATPPAAYSANAEFWVTIIREHRDRYRTGLTNDAMLAAVGDVAGLDLLDAGCGEGYLSRLFTERGARATGIDICPELVEAAQARALADGLPIDYQVGDVSALPYADETFDRIVANHLVNDLADPAPALAEFARVLRPGGTFTALILHPCFYGRRGERANPDSYYQARPITEHFLVDGLLSPAPATSWTRPLADYITMLAGGGFTVTAMSEPRPTDEQLANDPWWAEHFQYPLFLLITATKPAG